MYNPVISKYKIIREHSSNSPINHNQSPFLQKGISLGMYFKKGDCVTAQGAL